jgi:hypothetical protein
MGTEHRTPPTDTNELYDDLYTKLCEARSGVHQSKMAQALLREDRNGSHLVALVDDCERAVLFTLASKTLEAVPFDKHGTDENESEVLWRRLGDPRSWVDAYADGLEWVHPHYRWACELPDRTWSYTSP